MIINNEKTIIRSKLRKLLFAIIACAIIVTFFTTEIKYDGILGLSASSAAIIIAVLYVLYYLYQIYIDPYFIYFSDEGERIVLRFYSSRTANSKKMAVEIPKTDFHHYEIERAMINRKEKITIFQKAGKGVFKYPPFCLSALSKIEKNALLGSLNKYIEKE